MASSAAPPAMPAEAQNTVNQPGEELTDEQVMMDLFINQVQVQEDEEVVKETIAKLAEFKVDKPWKLQKCPDAALAKFLPLEGYFTHYLTAVHVRDTLVEWGKQQAQAAAPNTSDAALEAVRLMTQEMEKQRKQRKRNRDSDSEDETVKNYNCHKSLEKYGLSGIPNTHMAKVESMEKHAKKASTAYKTRGSFLLKEPVTDFVPTWMNDAQKPKDMASMQSHAHWVACYWARALSQLSAQGTAGEETVTPTDLLVHFLNMNQLAVERTTRTGWEFDKTQWANLSDRIRRQEQNLDVRAEFLKVTNEQVQKATEAALRQSKPKQPKTQYTQEPPTTTQPKKLPWYKPVPAQSSGEFPSYTGAGKGKGGYGKGGKDRKGGKWGKQPQPSKGSDARTKATQAVQTRQDKKHAKTE